MSIKISIFLLLLATGCFPVVGMANEDSAKTQELASQIATLKDEVTELKKAVTSLKATQPTITMLMPTFSERFHVMHYAGEAGDWAVAAHELQGLRHLVEVMQLVDPEKGAMVNGFLDANFNQLDAAIEHDNVKSFTKAMDKTLGSCNGCHVAVGSPSMKITLDASSSLSMRHSHDLGKSKMPGEHMHTN
jgi:outer membrane murein-binding lipoprotein Lpp